MLAGVGAIYLGICGFLHEKYKVMYDSEKAATLACVVVNELFFKRADRPDHDELYQQGVVEEAIRNLNNYEEIKEPYTQAIRVLNIIETQVDESQIADLRKGKPDLRKISEEEAIQRFEKAAEFGIFLKGGMAPQFDIFFDLAKSFYLRWMGKQK